MLCIALFVQPIAAAAQPIDVRVARWSQRSALQNSIVLDRTLATAEWVATPGAAVLPTATFVYARLGKHDALSESAVRVEASVLAASGITQILKRTVGRARPHAVNDSNPYDFAIGRRVRAGAEYRSFPSGHSTMAFAAATAVMLETRRTNPSRARTVTPAAYGLATLAGFGRIYHDKHWASDVLAGAIIGTLTAHAVDRIPPKRR